MSTKTSIRKVLAYVLLIAGLSFFIFAFIFGHNTPAIKKMLTFLLPAFYFVWGVVFHLKTNQITSKLIQEYLLISGICGVIIWFVLG